MLNEERIIELLEKQEERLDRIIELLEGQYQYSATDRPDIDFGDYKLAKKNSKLNE